MWRPGRGGQHRALKNLAAGRNLRNLALRRSRELLAADLRLRPWPTRKPHVPSLAKPRLYCLGLRGSGAGTTAYSRRLQEKNKAWTSGFRVQVPCNFAAEDPEFLHDIACTALELVNGSLWSYAAAEMPALGVRVDPCSCVRVGRGSRGDPHLVFVCSEQCGDRCSTINSKIVRRQLRPSDRTCHQGASPVTGLRAHHCLPTTAPPHP